LEGAVKRFSLSVLVLALVFAGCAQQKGTVAPQASRLDALDAELVRFQEQQRSRDAEIDRKLGEIATRLDRMTSMPVQPAAAKGRKGKEPVSAMAGTAHQPIVAGQVIPLAALEGGSAARTPGTQPVAPMPVTAPGMVQAPPPATRLAPGQVQPLSPASPASPASSASPAAPMQTAAPATRAYSALNPPVVTLAEPSSSLQPAPVRPAQPVPLETPRPVKGKASPRTSKPVAAAATAAAVAPSPAQEVPPASTAPAEMAPAIPSMGGAAPAASSAASPSGDLKEQQLYTEALRAVSGNHNEEGRKKFNDFMAKYPSSSKTPEALYWIGESYMGDKSYNQAILSFKEVTTRYPKDPKSADALYRIADAYERIGDKANAVFNLKLLLDDHPSSEFTGKAKQKLKQLGQ
jgi:tol-pal system protein YbgF